MGVNGWVEVREWVIENREYLRVVRKRIRNERKGPPASRMRRRSSKSPDVARSFGYRRTF